MLGPMTAGRPTEIPKSNELPTRDEILKVTKCFSSNGKVGTLALDVLTVAVKRAADDATTAGWLRTQEQVDGGPFSRPRKVLCLHDAAKTLRELDVARLKLSSKRVLDLTLEHDLNCYQDLPANMQVTILVNRAQRHHLTRLLAPFPGYRHVQQ